MRFRLQASAVVTVLACFSLSSIPCSAQQSSISTHPSNSDITDVAAELASTFKETGMSGVSRKVQTCYDLSQNAKPALLRCILFDVSIIRFDNIMRKLFVARGMNDPGPATKLFSPAALEARMEIYSSVVFGAGTSAIANYLGDSPTKVLDEVNRVIK